MMRNQNDLPVEDQIEELQQSAKQIISVKYKDKYTGQYCGRPYTYFCAMPSVSIGDIVVAPTYKGDADACVCEVGISPDSIDAELMKVLKTITRAAEKKEAEE